MIVFPNNYLKPNLGFDIKMGKYYIQVKRECVIKIPSLSISEVQPIQADHSER